MSGDPEDERRHGYDEGWEDGYVAGQRHGQRAIRAWLYGIGRYDIPAEEGGCIIVLDLRKLDAEFPDAVPSERTGS